MELGLKVFDKQEKKPNGAMAGFLGKGTFFEGKLSFQDTMRIDGNFKGEISSGGTLVVGEGAEIEADIKVKSAVITGTVRGVIEASFRVELQSHGKVMGEIRTPNLIIGEGAVFEGNCVMLKKDAQAEVVAYKPEAASERDPSGHAG